MRIAIDALGGDHAPAEIVAGSRVAARTYSDTEFILVGNESAVRHALDGDCPPNLLVRHAADVIGMDEHAAKSVRRKPDSSLCVAVKMVADGEADAIFSAGNTGAVTTAATLILGRQTGVFRPGIATLLPTRKGHCIVCDVGACVDCKSEWIAQFAVMAAMYAEDVEHMPNPRVGLLNIGEESSKGDHKTKTAHERLAASGLNWVGNVDGKDVFRGQADVIACDGFAGNLLLKAAEGTAEFLIDLVRQALTSSPLAKVGALLVQNGMRAVKSRLDYSEVGGAFLLGVQGLVVIGHGRSNAKAVCSALRRTREGVEHGLVGRLEARFASAAAEVNGTVPAEGLSA